VVHTTPKALKTVDKLDQNMVQKKQNNMMPKTLYRYSQEQRKQKPADILASDSGFQSNEVYLTFVQNLMKKGKKSTAENLFRKTLQILKQKTKNSENVFVVLEKAVKNVEPSFFLKKARLGGTSQQIPAALDKKKKKSTSIRALIQIATEKQKKSTQRKDIKLASTFTHFLANELYEASQGLGSALQKRDELHKLAESNRALLTQRWW
jgi:small subunit ribosomal protein S7